MRIRNKRGYTILEVLIAVFITGLLAASGFQFYATMHNQTLTQEERSEMQHASRVTLQEIAKTLRMAGYKLGGAHVPYAISVDTLTVFFSQTQPVDTVMYFLDDAGGMYAMTEGEEGQRPPRQLMKKVNSQAAAVFANGIDNISYVLIDSENISISVTSRTLNRDQEYDENDGYRTLITSERVKMRNVGL